MATEAFVDGKRVYVNVSQSKALSLPAATVNLWSGTLTPYNIRVPLANRIAGQPLTMNWSFQFYNGEVNTNIQCYIASSSGGTNLLLGSRYLSRQWNGYTGTYSISGTVTPSWSGDIYLVVKTSSNSWDDTGGSSRFYASTPQFSYTGKLTGGIE